MNFQMLNTSPNVVEPAEYPGVARRKLLLPSKQDVKSQMQRQETITKEAMFA